MTKRRKQKWTVASVIGAVIIGAGTYLVENPHILSNSTPPQTVKVDKSSQQGSGKVDQPTQSASQIDYGSIADNKPTQSLAFSVMTDNVKKQLGSDIQYSSAGAFLINNSQSDLKTDISSAPYVQLSQLDQLGRPQVANAWLSQSSRQYKNRNETTNANGKSNASQINPIGWNQLMLKGGKYATLYNRGHSIAYALAGSIKTFDASEANPQNITTQTAWANQASNGDANNTGQNYYESLIRKALDNRKKVRYRVTPIYDGDNKIPSGSHLEAKSSDKSLEFNVFVPNVEPGVKIDYATGLGQIVK